MDPRAFRVAQQFVRAHLRRAKYAPEFLQTVEGRRFRNPETGNEVKFLSLPDPEQQRIYDQWRTKHNVQDQGPKETREQVEARNIDIARNGRVQDRRPLFEGGRGGSGPVNQSFIVKLEHNGQTQNYIFKPAKGEEQHLRIGIPGGQYHAREQAAYTIDRLIGGRGIVPVTQTRGSDDGSYQLWAQGARQMHGEDMDHLVDRVPLSELASNQDFQRLNVLDLLLGHEDRHRGNLLYSFDGDESPENLRFIAIDNGLSMASPSEHPDHRVYANPFTGWYIEPEGASHVQKKKLQRQGEKEGNAAVAKSLSRISPELHERLQEVDLTEMAKAMTAAGIDEEGAVRAALVRLVALQQDPTIFREMLRRSGDDLGEAWREFQHLSGYRDDLLWRTGAGDREEEIDAAVARARPRGGWTQPMSLEEANKAMQDLDGWGQSAPPDAATAPAQAPADKGTVKVGPPPEPPKEPDRDERKVDEIKFDENGFAILATNVKDRWLRAKVTGRPRGRTLTVSILDMRTRKPKVVGVFTLDRSNKVKESYKDSRFRNEIQRGLRLMGKVITPKDGPRFMGALEKVYGARSMYEVRRS